MKTRHFTCDTEKCFKSFRTEKELKTHQETHCLIKKDKKDFSCDICGRILATKQSLKEHSFTHEKKKYFRCSETGCGKTFKQSSQLCNHKKVHKEARKMVLNEEAIEDSESLENVQEACENGKIYFPVASTIAFRLD